MAANASRAEFWRGRVARSVAPFRPMLPLEGGCADDHADDDGGRGDGAGDDDRAHGAGASSGDDIPGRETDDDDVDDEVAGGVLVVDKPAGLPCSPHVSNTRETLGACVAIALTPPPPPSTRGVAGAARPSTVPPPPPLRPAHRIDVPVTGLVALGRDAAGADGFSRALKAGRVTKRCAWGDGRWGAGLGVGGARFPSHRRMPTSPFLRSPKLV